MNGKRKKLVIALSGASGSVYSKVLFDKLSNLGEQYEEIALVASDNAKQIWKHELKDQAYNKYSFKEFLNTDFYAPFASGSAQFDTMIICPCSMGTLGRIANGISNDLITRSADVILKERRKLILVPRETPYNLIHIKNMERITLAGGIICPATPSFYGNPETIEDVASTVVDRVLDLAGFTIDTNRWSQ
jgi:4-hydroxy-3-polyprenylbenzoate decarboxylase